MFIDISNDCRLQLDHNYSSLSKVCFSKNWKKKKYKSWCTVVLFLSKCFQCFFANEKVITHTRNVDIWRHYVECENLNTTYNVWCDMTCAVILKQISSRVNKCISSYNHTESLAITNKSCTPAAVNYQSLRIQIHCLGFTVTHILVH